MTLPYPPLPYLPLRPPLPPIPLPALTSHPSRPGVVRDYFYISADRYDWRESKPMEGQKLTAHRKWLDCWQVMGRHGHCHCHCHCYCWSQGDGEAQVSP